MEMDEGKDEGKVGMKHKREEIITSQEFIMIVFRFLLHILSLGHFSFGLLGMFLCLSYNTLFLDNNAISLSVLQWMFICMWI